MRIDLMITELPVGGAERCLTELACGLHRRGHAVRMIAFGPPPPPPQDELLRRLQKAGVPFLSAGTDAFYLAPMALQRVRRMLLRDRPEIVQTFLFHANVLGTAAAVLAGVPIRIGGVRVAQPYPWRLMLERRMIRKMQALVCVSDSVAEFTRQHLAASDSDIRVIPNAVDVPRFAAAAAVDWRSWGLPQDASVVLFIGRLDPQKGLERLFAAAAKFLAADERRWLVLIGEGPQRHWCREQCEQLPGRRAQVLSWQPDVAPFLAAAELLVLTSRYEGMPNAVLEAMAAGKAVVCNEVQGAAELLQQGDLVRFAPRQLVPQGDVEAIAGAVDYLLSRPAEAQEIGAANQAQVRRTHTIEAMVDRYESLYKELHARLASEARTEGKAR